MKKQVALIFILAALIANNYLQAQSPQKVPLKHGANRNEPRRTDAAMNTWRGHGLGQFIHYGLYSILAGKWNGAYYNGAAEWIRSWNKMDKKAYDSLNKQFNPTAFNPLQWAAMGKQMGAKYVTITTKHHDGFCLWPSRYTNYTVANSPYKKDMIGPLVKAYDAKGIDVHLYFSVMDWSHPDWRTDIKSVDDSLAFERFKTFTTNQLLELVQLYPTIKGLWFDGTWDKSWKLNGAYSDYLEQLLKNKIPGLIIGSRLRADEWGNRGFDANGQLMGDYQQGWERKLPKKIEDLKGNDWDCIMTIPENGWGYAEKWLGHWKTTYELLEMLAHCVSMDGNFVINFGPKGNGAFDDKEVKNAKEVGDWMQINNRAIYNCGYADGWEKQDWGYYTKPYNDSTTVYMIVFNTPISGNLKVLPPINRAIEKLTIVGQPVQVIGIEKLDYGASYIKVPELNTKTEPFVIEVKLKTNTTIGTEQKAKT
mgnify:CR=1 FL=1